MFHVVCHFASALQISRIALACSRVARLYPAQLACTRSRLGAYSLKLDEGIRAQKAVELKSLFEASAVVNRGTYSD